MSSSSDRSQSTESTPLPLEQPEYPILTTRLRLRPVELSDLADINSYRSIPAVAEFLPHEPHSLEDTRATLSKMIAMSSLTQPGDWIDFAVELVDSPGVIGEVLLKWDKDEPKNGEVGFVFHPNVHGTGIPTEAVRAALRVAFEHFGWHRVHGVCDIQNLKSAALMRRLGMKKQAELVDVKWQKGRWLTLCHYAILEHEWRAPNT
ncbi:MAG: GNAT family N-acetyltransferase [Microbacteriaceae bacterium]|nr:GNAT family N-acetyltransferase [Microbacteriaceae bacterium]